MSILPSCMCITCMFGACRKHKRESDPLELLELDLLSHHMDTGNLNQVL